MPAGHAERRRQKLYTDIWHVAVIAVSCANGRSSSWRRVGRGVETRARQSRPLSQEVVLCLRSKHTCAPTALLPSPRTGEPGGTETVGSSPTLQASLRRSTPSVDPGTESDAGPKHASPRYLKPNKKHNFINQTNLTLFTCVPRLVMLGLAVRSIRLPITPRAPG